MLRFTFLFSIHFVIFLISPSLTFSQKSNLQQFGPSQGLSSSQVYNIQEDKWGYLWFLTDNGLSRYNGYEFEQYLVKDGLIENIYLNATKGPDGNLWLIGLKGTIIQISDKKPTFTPYKYNSITTRYNNCIVNDFYFSKTGTLYISYHHMSDYLEINIQGQVLTTPSPLETDTYFISRKNNKWIYQTNKLNANDSILFKIKIDKTLHKGIMRHKYVGSDFDLYSLKEMNSYLKINDSIIKLNDKNNTNIIGSYTDSTFFIGYEKGGLIVYDLEGNPIERFLTTCSVSNAYCDREGNLWFSTLENGVFLKRNNPFKPLLNVEQNEDIPYKIARDKETLYFSCSNGNILKYQNGKLQTHLKSVTPQTIPLKYFPLRKRVFTIRNRIISPVDNIDENITVNDYTPNGAYDILELSDSSILVCCYSLSRKINSDGQVFKIPNLRKTYSAVQYNKRVFIGGINGLFLIEGDSTAIHANLLVEDIRVNHMIVYNGHLLIGTNSQGIIVMKDTTIVNRISPEYLGISSINQLLLTNENQLWIAGRTGLVKLQLNPNQEYSKFLFNSSHGLINTEIQAIELLNDTLFTATRSGLFILPNLNQRIEPSFQNNFLSIHEVLINDSLNLSNSNHLKLDYTQNRIEFNFGAISLKRAEHINYRFKLTGWENSWNYTNNRNTTYKNLVPGNYNFILQSSILNSPWKQSEVNMTFSISPPFWKTWWFIISIITTLLFCIYLFFKYRVLIYNADLVRELLRQIIKRLKRHELLIVIQDGKKTIKIPTKNVLYVKSQRNYIEIIQLKKKDVVRMKISDFLKNVPDPQEYIQINRSHIVRIDRITQKEKKKVVVQDVSIPVGPTYEKELNKTFI